MFRKNVVEKYWKIKLRMNKNETIKTYVSAESEEVARGIMAERFPKWKVLSIEEDKE